MNNASNVNALNEGVRIALDPSGFADWASLHTLLSDSFAYMDGRIDPPSSLAAMTAETLATKAGDEHLVVARAGEELVGCGFLAERDETIYLGKLAVGEAWRGRGILRAMLGRAEQLARRRRKPYLELQTRIELTESHDAFAALGFVKTAETAHAGFDRPTSITMRRTVGMAMRRGDNGGPPLDDHLPPWGKSPIRSFVAWRSARRVAWTVTPEVARRRASKAKACGVTFEEYMLVLLDTGRYLQPCVRRSSPRSSQGVRSVDARTDKQIHKVE